MHHLVLQGCKRPRGPEGPQVPKFHYDGSGFGAFDSALESFLLKVFMTAQNTPADSGCIKRLRRCAPHFVFAVWNV